MTEATDTALPAGDLFDLAIAVRDALENRLEGSDRISLLSVYGIRDDPDLPWTDVLIKAGAERLIALAGYLDVKVPGPAPRRPQETGSVDAYSELVAAETALRDVIRLVVPGWASGLTEEELQKLRDKQSEEDKKRDGVAVSPDLLDYTEIYLLRRIIEKNWGEVKPVLDDRKRTEVYLDIIFDVRNTIGHSRPVVPAERLLLAGASGQIRNQLARFRSSVDGAANHYSSIDSARDSFGIDAQSGASSSDSPGNNLPRLEVGETVRFELAGTDPRGRELSWIMYVSTMGFVGGFDRSVSRVKASGDRVEIAWEVSTTDVGEGTTVAFALRNSSKYQRSWGYDGICSFKYRVNPPIE
ncbi:hypothetical protein R4P47_00805 [Rhodococcus sp. IEGM 1370]|uniref:hypothetical protein n=1 Tax=Rhodococcus sp. IEGM 1370 TaxID=3082222 RepID=UPI0029541569|nr:hypothetical protein [Rhodococcus sp. IEGM 1370]MDV8075081.1 hypothetical protein [Rhodococcus sp. IEGM 1370]